MGKKEMPIKRKNTRDYGAIGRRVDLLYWISGKRETNYREIQERYSINPYSVKKDLDSLEFDFGVPLSRTHRGIRVKDGWYAQRPHFKSDENKLLYDLLKVVPEEYVEPIKQLIREYGNPAGLDEIIS